MKRVSFPHCCTASIIIDLGESIVAEGGPKNYSVEEIENFIRDSFKSVYCANEAATVIITNSDQKRANKALRNLGFEHSTWMSKKAHKNTKIRLWWKQTSKV